MALHRLTTITIGVPNVAATAAYYEEFGLTPTGGARFAQDPAGNFAEYYADLDCIVDDQLWTPGVWEGMKGLYSWGPPVPPSFLAPDDLAELMAGMHSA